MSSSAAENYQDQTEPAQWPNHKSPTPLCTCSSTPPLWQSGLGSDHTTKKHSTAMPNSSFPPVPAPTAATRRRRRQLHPSSSSSSSSNSTVPTSTSGASASSTSSSSSSSASSSLSFPSFSPAPSPFHHRFLSPLRSSAVPFSWEHRPGIPKTPARQAARGKAAAALPLPPSLLSSKVGAAADSFPAAAASGYLIVPDDAKARRRTRRPPALAATLTDWLAVLSLYRSCSCTRSRDCLAGTPPPRPRSPAKAST